MYRTTSFKASTRPFTPKRLWNPLRTRRETQKLFSLFYDRRYTPEELRFAHKNAILAHKELRTALKRIRVNTIKKWMCRALDHSVPIAKILSNNSFMLNNRSLWGNEQD